MVVVLDAREGTGGRIATVHDPSWPLPVELGPEFIHGRPKATLEILDASGLLAVRLSDARWIRGARGWVRPGRLVADHRRDHGPDAKPRNGSQCRRVPAAHPRISRSGREMLLSFVEGYDAAPAARLSEHSISRRGKKSESHDQFRIVNGYDRLTDWLARSAGPGSLAVQLRTVVRRIRWSRGSVEIESVPREDPFDSRRRERS